MTTPPPVDSASSVLVFGYGLHGRAVASALLNRDHRVMVADDSPSDASAQQAADAGLKLVAAPSPADLSSLMQEVTHFVPTPGLADRHPAFSVAAEFGVPTLSEFDLARQWDDRPTIAITGTNGKTTVTTMVAEMLVDSGQKAVMAGNMDLPLVTAIEDRTAEVFVVEASSFRLGHSALFAPRVGTWLNFEPDHLDVHASLEAYEAAKARIWSDQGPDGVAIANAKDRTVMRNLPGRASDVTFGAPGSEAAVVEDTLVVSGAAIIDVNDLARRLPHDIDNALAAALTALTAGASEDAVRRVLADFAGLEHRVQLIAEAGGVRWYDDSKATTPHAVLAGVGGFDSAVLIAGGRNKGVDLAPIAALAPSLRAVVAIGEASDEIVEVFRAHGRVVTADSMEEAVVTAAGLAQGGDAVILSPACTSYDWYPNYSERGDDFTRLVRQLIGSDDRTSDQIAGQEMRCR